MIGVIGVWRRHRAKYSDAYLMIAPLVVLIVLFVLVPFVLSLVYSFKNMVLTDPDNVRWVGFKNYSKLFRDPAIGNALRNTLFYAAVTVFFEMLFGLLAALLLRRNFKLRFAVLACMILPWALPPVVGGVTWRWIFNPQYGVVNVLFERWGWISEYQLWTMNKWAALSIVSLIVIWRNLPYAALIMLSFLQQIPGDLYESASIDGAGGWQQFRRITLPLMMPGITIAVSLSTMTSLNLFDEPYIMNQYSVDTMSILIENYNVAFRDLKFGYGMAISMMVTVLTLVINYSYIRSLYKEEPA
jgi:multiple sugar transport system permease protein